MNPNILFLCTGNSCRSQMAEGWGKALKSAHYNFYSAGIVTHGLNSLAVKVMQQVGIDINQQESKTIDQLPAVKMDYVITVCSNADKTCPVFAGGKVIACHFDDPPSLTKDLQDKEAILAVYQRVRDEIKIMVVQLDDLINKRALN
ncbi:MAG: arsenate reductase ArsC [Enterobacterales bacterium]|nr:arsenate reductase ArsC [Enterobacterales bacterium]